MDYAGRHYPNKLRKYRNIFGYSQLEVAQKLGVDRAQVSKWETAEAFPGLVNVMKLSILYHTLPMELYRELFVALKEELQELKPFSCLTDVSEDE